MSGLVADLSREFDADRMLLLFSTRSGGPPRVPPWQAQPALGACRRWHPFVGSRENMPSRARALDVRHAKFQSRTLKIEQERASGINFGQEPVEQWCDHRPSGSLPSSGKGQNVKASKRMSTDHPNGSATRSIGKRSCPAAGLVRRAGVTHVVRCPLADTRVSRL
jgi:hypothetical protein